MIFTPALVALFLLIWSIRLFGSVINPVALFSIGMVLPLFFAGVLDGVASNGIEIDFPVLIDSNPDTILSTAFAYILALFAFALPFALGSRQVAHLRSVPPHAMEVSEAPYLKRCLLWAGVVVVGLIGFVSYYLGAGIPIVSMVSGVLDVRDFDQALYDLPFGMMAAINTLLILLLLWVVCLFFDPQSGLRDWRRYAFIMVLFLPVLVWNGKRQLILFFLVVFFMNYWSVWSTPQSRRVLNVSPSKLAALALMVLLAIFVAVDAVRYQDGLNGGSNALIFLGYLTWPARNMMSIYENLGFQAADAMQVDGYYVLAELMPARWGGKQLAIDSGRFVYEPTSPSGYLAYWWFDGGLMFALFGVFLFGSIALIFYFKKHLSQSMNRIYLLVLWCCLTSGVYSHFISLNYFVFPMLLLLVEHVVCRAPKFGLKTSASDSDT